MAEKIDISEINLEKSLLIIDRIFRTPGDRLKLTYTDFGIVNGEVTEVNRSFVAKPSPITVDELTNKRISELTDLLEYIGNKVEGNDVRIEGIETALRNTDRNSQRDPNAVPNNAGKALSGIHQLLDMPDEAVAQINAIRTAITAGTSEAAIGLTDMVSSLDAEQLDAVGDLINYRIRTEETMAAYQAASDAGDTKKAAEILAGMSGNSQHLVENEAIEELTAPLFEAQPAAREAFANENPYGYSR